MSKIRHASPSWLPSQRMLGSNRARFRRSTLPIPHVSRSPFNALERSDDGCILQAANA